MLVLYKLLTLTFTFYVCAINTYIVLVFLRLLLARAMLSVLTQYSEQLSSFTDRPYIAMRRRLAARMMRPVPSWLPWITLVTGLLGLEALIALIFYIVFSMH